MSKETEQTNVTVHISMKINSIVSLVMYKVEPASRTQDKTVDGGSLMFQLHRILQLKSNHILVTTQPPPTLPPLDVVFI